MNVLVIGLGEIGTAISHKISKAVHHCDVYDIKHGKLRSTLHYICDVVHICFPQHNKAKFIVDVFNYIKELKPKWCFIHSTVSIGVCERIQREQQEYKYTEVIHMPIRGSHDNIDFGLREFTLYVGPTFFSVLSPLMRSYLTDIFNEVKIMEFKSSKETELAKLLSVVWYGMNIAFVQEAKHICDKLGIDFNQAYTEYFKTDKIGSRYKEIGGKVRTTDTIYRPIFYPGFIGGKCVIQDVKLLLPNAQNKKLFEFILESNESFRPKCRIFTSIEACQSCGAIGEEEGCQKKC